MNSITRFIDNYLTQTGRSSIDPVEANALLAGAGILHNSKDRPGKPLREKLRKGELPHAFQSGGKGTNWTIPHSTKQIPILNSNDPVDKTHQKKVPSASTENSIATLSKSFLQIEELLMDEFRYKNTGKIDNLIPQGSGIYCIRISGTNKLPSPFNEILADRQHNIIYIGIASGSLKRRLLNQELRANGHGTFFRIIGAILGYKPPKGSLVGKANRHNYKFAPMDEHKILSWINDNLLVNWIELKGDFEVIETELIVKYRPLINLAKNPSALQLISKLRKECVEVANER